MEAGSTQIVAFYMHLLQNLCFLIGSGELRVFIRNLEFCTLTFIQCEEREARSKETR